MNNFTVIYRILKAFEAAMDTEAFDTEMIAPERLKITENRRDKLLLQLYKAGYIEGLCVKKYVDSPLPAITINPDATITLRGLEYLEENSMMNKARDVLKEVRDWLPKI